jgi:hypothetical protein
MGERQSVRKRMIDRRSGRPEEFTIKTRAAMDREISSSGKGLAGDYGTIRTQGSIGIAASGTPLERSVEK